MPKAEKGKFIFYKNFGRNLKMLPCFLWSMFLDEFLNFPKKHLATNTHARTPNVATTFEYEEFKKMTEVTFI